MIRGKYGAVIGRNTRFFNALSINFQATGSFKPITAQYFSLILKPRNLAKLQCKQQWLTPPIDLTRVTWYCEPQSLTPDPDPNP